MIVAYDPSNPLSDFRNFLSLVWDHLGLGKPTRRQLAIAYYLQYEENPRRMVEAFRGIGKSWLTAAFVLFCLYNNPALNILVVSASSSKAQEFSTFVKRLIDDMAELSHLRSRDGQRSSILAFDVGPAPASQAPSVKSCGITGQITGSRADLIIPDDIEVPANSDTQLQRDKLAERVKEFDAVLKPGGEIVYLGTPQSESSIYNRLPDRGYKIRIWPARYPDQKRIDSYTGRLAPDITEDLSREPRLEGKPTEPTRFTDDDLAARELSYGKAGWSLQFMLDTNLSDAERYPLKLRDLVTAPLMETLAPEKVVWSTDREYAVNDVPIVGIEGDRYYRAIPLPNITYLPYSGKVLAVDPSGRGRDETAYAVIGMCNGLLYLLDAGGFIDGYADTTLMALAEIARKWQVQTTIVEANYGDGMFTKLLTPWLVKRWPNTIEEVKHSTQKEKRIIDTLGPVIASHRLVVNRDLIQKDYDSTREYAERGMEPDRVKFYQLFHQLTRITRDRGSLAQDDRLDALSIGVAYWVEAMGKDVERSVQEHRDRLMGKELEKFRRGVFGMSKLDHQQRKTWVSQALAPTIGR